MHENIPDLEDRLRRALHAEAQQARPDLVGSHGTGSPARGTHPRRLRWPRLAGPIAAACAMLAVIAGVTLAGRNPASRPGPTAATRADASSTGPAGTPTDFPPFVVVDHASSLEVFNTRTGAAAGTLNAPARLQFQGVASGGTSQTFLAFADRASGNACHAYFYRFKLAATGKPSDLTLIRSIPGSLGTAVAASPGGGSYTYSVVHCVTAPPNGLIGISGRAGNHTWAYDEGDDYTFSLAATADADTLALSLYVGSGWANLLLNTGSRAATVDGASRVVPAMPYAQTLEISPGGKTLYACISNGNGAAGGLMGELDAYSAVTGKLIRVLHRWTLSQGQHFFCDVTADATGRVLLATYFSDLARHPSLIGIDPQTGTAVKLPIKADYVVDGVQATW